MICWLTPELGREQTVRPDRKEILRAGPGRSHSARKDDLATDSLQLGIEQHFLDVAYDRCNPERPLLAYLGLCFALPVSS